MRYRLLLPGVLALSALALAACGDETTTQPTPAAEPNPTAPELAVASNSWITRADMPTRTDLATATLTNGAGESIVYAIGGLNPNRVPLDKVTAYNVATNTWTFRRPLPTPVAGSNGAGVINGKIYVSGGYSDWGGDFPRRWLYMYDPATNTWTRKSDIPVVTDELGREYIGAGGGSTGVISGKLYVASGCFMADPPHGYYEDCFPLFFRYNPVTDRWVTLPAPFAGLPTVTPLVGGVIGGKFYVMGRSPYTHDARFALYDPATNQWTARTPLGRSRPRAAAAVLQGKLYLMGGTRIDTVREALDTLDITIAYDPVTDTWTRRGSLPSPRLDISATRVFLNGQARIEVLGGIAPGNNLQYVP